MPPPDETAATPTERATAQAELLLARHGIVSRDALRGEERPGGFSALYRVLVAMEDSGRTRRGLFVDGGSSAQFADPGAAEQLRALRDEGPRVRSRWLAATDPANPFGATLPWPSWPDGAPPLRRAAGARVLLVDGHLALYIAKTGEHLGVALPHSDVARDRVAGACRDALATPGEADLARGIRRVNGEARESSALGAMLGLSPRRGRASRG